MGNAASSGTHALSADQDPNRKRYHDIKSALFFMERLPELLRSCFPAGYPVPTLEKIERRLPKVTELLKSELAPRLDELSRKVPTQNDVREDI